MMSAICVLWLHAIAAVALPTSTTDIQPVIHQVPRRQQLESDNDVQSPLDTAFHPVLPVQLQPLASPIKVRQCEPIRIDLCQGLGYNVTGFPNLVGHDSALDAEQQLLTFGPLIQYECSFNGELRLFLCAVYVPMCTEQFPDVIGPCRSVCERVRSSCEPILQHFGFPWPTALRCDRFHARNNENDHMCMEGPQGNNVTQPEHRPVDQQQHKIIINDIGSECPDASGCGDDVPEGARCATANNSSTVEPMSAMSSTELIRVWTVVWSIAATLSTLFVIVTFAVDASRYSYADRVVLLIAICSAICAVGHLSRQVFVSEQVTGLSSASNAAAAAAQHHHPPCHPHLHPGDDVQHESLSSRAEPGSHCTVAFVVVYYFSTASSLWWLILTVVLVLQAPGDVTATVCSSRYWTDATIRRRLSTGFHLVAWSTTAIATIVILVRKDIELDPTSSEPGTRLICQVKTGSSSILGLVLIPLSVCLSLGVVLLLVGTIRSRLHLCRSKPSCAQSSPNPLAVGSESECLKEQTTYKEQPPPAVVCPTLTTDSAVVETDDEHSNNEGTVRVGVMAVVGAVALVGLVTCDTHEFLHQATSPVAVLVKTLSSVLVALVIGPWLVMSGQASASWNSFVVRRRESKNAPMHHSRQQQQQQQQGTKPRTNGCCDRECFANSTHRHMTSKSASLSLHCPAGNHTSHCVHDVTNRRLYPHATLGNDPMTKSKSAHASGRRSKTHVGSEFSSVSHTGCDVGVHRFHGGFYPRQNVTVGNPPPPPPSQCTSQPPTVLTMSCDDPHLFCRQCRHQHHQYVI